MIRTSGGFTVVELLVVIAVIGILLTIAVVTPLSTMPVARDNERADDTASIARRLEQAYNEQTVGSPSTPIPAYPTTARLMCDASGIPVASCGANPTCTAIAPIGTMAFISPDALKAPNSSSCALLSATSAGAQSPALNKYVYQPLTATNTLCDGSTGNTVCVRYFLYYQKETVSGASGLMNVRSLHQQ